MRHQQSLPDESYASDTNSAAGADEEMLTQSDHAPSTASQLLKSISGLPESERIVLVQHMLRTFPVARLVEFHEHLATMVYFDPVSKLPNELILHTFSNLSPHDLLTCSLVSRGWRERALDERLWRDCFSREGWDMDTAKFREHERSARSFGFTSASRRLNDESNSSAKREGRKRPRDEAFNDNGKQPIADEVEDHDMDFDENDHMEGVKSSSEDGRASSSEKGVIASTSPSKFSWPWIYKQRRLLERNWEKGKYASFRLPHPQHEHEGHTECVYTIQHIGDTLVSGSRDASIRIWDLSTYRLKAKPLYGHDASVLCLQFDDRPEEDIIISGGSDNYVIVWKFSTGEIIKKMTDAHTESVLNLRFDERYLVTCSKDKTIKIWNRKEISNTDPIIPMRAINAFANMDIIPPLTLLDAFGGSRDGHGAAVNAVQIHGDIIVSASGDRCVKAWNIHTGYPMKKYEGHTKGIACVQFDGRRVVSGSSDNTVRIFDYETYQEIACLDGHSDLVRTVQARFGDLRIISDEELHAQARQVDANFRRAAAAGAIEERKISRRGPGRNAGSSDPNKVLSLGNKIPPGGGGSKWARIVSGSYDETVIVWKRDGEGNWKPNQRLHQGMLPNTRAAAAARSGAAFQPAITPALAVYPLTAADAAAQQAQVQQAQIRQQAATAALAQRQQAQQQLAAPAAGPSTASRPILAQTAVGPGTQGPSIATAAPAPGPANLQPHHHHHGHHHHHHHHHRNPAAAAAARAESNRVFKLQFDARRIIACSQNRVIVGWDFAAGNKDLEMIGDWSSETP
ncbi:WD40 repeat-like protein [Dissoconium aciculare CBS 342.82]|uniref:WD40 repeat-like protein n=1 Tax=Dissoconium aciculare CBS 342.82 TaxID=1314786 RepID=A0A6J3M272_9PEZI|nr:WD40 repeat-like protein [Dissoconium aciculare CBS 342.82]KAF1822008.1 WD40 repeat-like protein [Dissoconium aciculare CBS 342.82]